MLLQARLVQMFAAMELGLDTDMLSYRLRQLTLLLPDLGALSTWCSSTVQAKSSTSQQWAHCVAAGRSSLIARSVYI